MALTADAKEELSHLEVNRPSARKAEASAMLRFAGGLHLVGGRIVVEVKNRRRLEVNDWLEQAERERGNADAAYGVVVFHWNGIGLSRMGEQGVLMTLDTFARLIGGEPNER